MTVPEDNVLQVKDSRIKDSDNWPSYILKRTRIVSTTTGEPVSLFSANTDHPVKVIGTLETVDPSYRHCGI